MKPSCAIAQKTRMNTANDSFITIKKTDGEALMSTTKKQTLTNNYPNEKNIDTHPLPVYRFNLSKRQRTIPTVGI